MNDKHKDSLNKQPKVREVEVGALIKEHLPGLVIFLHGGVNVCILGCRVKGVYTLHDCLTPVS